MDDKLVGKMKDMGIEGEFKQHYAPPIAGAKEKSVMTMEAVVDATPQELSKLKDFHALTKAIPTTVTAQGQIVLQALFACFDKKQSTEEGLIGDLIWGFDKGGIPKQCTIDGLKSLAKEGFIKFQAKDNTFVTFESDKITGAWVRYQPKLMELIYEGSIR